MGFGRRVAAIVIISCFLVAIIEGLASYGLVIHNVMATKSLAKRQHTKYDANLGWVNETNVYIPDIYGPGIYLRTNAQGFRNSHDINAAVPKGKVRIVCSGDSFTEGYGVDNDHTWCARLSALDPRLEAVNMGQDGYGADQAYLWYKTGAAGIAHQVQLFAFITDDFYRMLYDSFLGYAKPRLEVENGVLVAKNVPVPRRDYYFPWITQNAENLKSLRTVQFLNKALRKIRVEPAGSTQLTQKERDEKARKILRSLFQDLKRMNEHRSSKLVLVYLPTIWELNGASPQWQWTAPKEWTEFLDEESGSLGIPFINFFSEFNSRPYDEMARLFIPKGQLSYPEAEGHLNNAGNETVARLIYDKLMTHPAISCALSTRLGSLLRETAAGDGYGKADRRPACPRS
jgi:lysophospholipase L1-like esterase